MVLDPETATLRQLLQSVKAAVGGARVLSAGLLAPVETLPGFGALAGRAREHLPPFDCRDECTLSLGTSPAPRGFPRPE